MDEPAHPISRNFADRIGVGYYTTSMVLPYGPAGSIEREGTPAFHSIEIVFVLFFPPDHAL